MKKKMIYLFLLGLLLFFVLGSTSPDSVKLPVYLLIFSIIYMITALIIYIVGSLAYPGASNSKRWFVSIVLAFCPVIVIALESMSTVSLLDIILAISAPSVMVWYGLKRI